jgi:hypothetical protein
MSIQPGTPRLSTDLLPLLDANMFVDGVVARLLQEGYRDDEPEGVLTLLVFALGQLTIEGMMGQPTRVNRDDFGGSVVV